MLLGLLLSGLFTACDKEKVNYGGDEEVEFGQLSLGGLELTVSTEATSRAEDDATKDFKVGVYDATNTLISKLYTYSDMPAIVPVKVGTHTLKVQSGEKMDEVSANPFYAASQSITIQKDKVAESKKVVCTLANTKVVLTIGDLKDELQSGYTIQVSNGATGIHLFTEEEINLGKAMYFKTATTKKLEVTLIGKRPDGQPVRETSVIDANGGESHKITINVIQTGTAKSTLKIDSTMEVVDKNVDVPVDEDIIKPDPTPTPDPDPNPDPNPDPTPDEYTLTIEGKEFYIDQAVVIPAGQTRTIIVDFESSLGLKNLHVEIVSPILTPEFLASVNLSSTFDLANPGALEAPLKQLEFPVGAEVLGQKSLVFNISQFVPIMSGLGAATHQFKLKAIDASNHQLQKTLTITIE